MRFTLSSSMLNSRLQILSRVINSKSSISILDCFLFDVKQNLLTITASDSENVMQTTLSLDSSENEGCFAIPSRTILEAVKELPEQPLIFDVNLNDMTIEVMYQNGRYKFTAQNGSEYPIAESVANDATVITIDSAQLSDSISRSLFATAQDELRPVMNGIYFDLTNECLTVVASDGHKLVRNKILTVKSDTPASFILPKKPATLLKSVLGRNEGEVTIKFHDRSAEIIYADGSLSCRLIEGRYPNYNSVIPQNNPNQLTIDRKALIGALRRVLPFASESSQLVRFHLSNGNMELTSEDMDFATSAKENIICDYNGNVMDIGFKGSSLYEILTNIDGDDIVMYLADPSRAGVIEPAMQSETDEILMLIMPMLLND
ncbi:MAG: DNA polymerase III subunit beta [Prevotella sp.]